MNRQEVLAKFQAAFYKLQIGLPVQIHLSENLSQDTVPICAVVLSPFYQKSIDAGNEILRLLSSPDYQFDKDEAGCLEMLVETLEKLDRQKPEEAIDHIRVLLTYLDSVHSNKFSYSYPSSEMLEAILFAAAQFIALIIISVAIIGLVGLLSSSLGVGLAIGAGVGLVVGLCNLLSERGMFGKKSYAELEIANRLNPFVSKPESPYENFSRSLFGFFDSKPIQMNDVQPISGESLESFLQENNLRLVT